MSSNNHHNIGVILAKYLIDSSKTLAFLISDNFTKHMFILGHYNISLSQQMIHFTFSLQHITITFQIGL